MSRHLLTLSQSATLAPFTGRVSPANGIDASSHYFPPAISVEACDHLKSVRSTPAAYHPLMASTPVRTTSHPQLVLRHLLICLRQDRNDFAHCSPSVSGSRVDAKRLLRHHLVTVGNWLPFGTFWATSITIFGYLFSIAAFIPTRYIIGK